ncbi:uroporphyrinogen-III C-methyltransferase [Pseudactinotalea suaedae]|uniref:uroporphyrinogen-III C-methyltransferase n=1 Tax=Pseudactinotalea suaedae TaxID=1524924 RepID=UPI0012E203B7|nr:uroporphyrinogen-III C-methyltransferase [Pseudactinotalea suaedae]
MTPALLVGLPLAGRDVLVTGGGPAAAAHVAALRQVQARVRVVAPHVCEDLRDLVAEHGATVRLDEREPTPVDLDGVWLVVAADDSARDRSAVQGWAEARRTWCVVSDDPAAAQIHDADGLLDRGEVDLRRPPGTLGSVTLVGGGPGAAELITVAGRRALAEADVIVTDRLGPRSVLAHVRPGVEVIDVGKTPGHHPVPQHEINRILVEQAQLGRRVIRLKGGDPFLLGRGGEEVLACQEAAVPVDVIPGISSAFAVPALAGIPVTQREVVAAVHVTSGHEPLAEAALACVRDASATLVVLMGVGNLGHIVEQLRSAGANPATPVAIVERGSTPAQRLTRATLADVVAVAAEVRVRAPAVIVIGAVAAS